MVTLTPPPTPALHAATPRCCAIGRVTPGAAHRCSAPVAADSVVHCAEHAAALCAAVARYKQAQRELDAMVSSQPASWSVLEAWLVGGAALSDVRRARRAARLLHRVAQRRLDAEIAAHYGPPTRILATMPAALAAALGVPRSLAGVMHWPDPATAPDAGHVFAILRCLELRQTLLLALPPPSPPPPAPAGDHPQPPVDDDADDDSDDDGIDVPAPQPQPAVQRGGRTPDVRLRAWTEQERGVYEVYWAWHATVAPVHPEANLREKYDRGLPEVLGRLMRVMPLFGARGQHNLPTTSSLTCLLDTIGNLDAAHAALFCGDLAWRQMLMSGSMAMNMCRDMLRELAKPLITRHNAMLPTLYGASVATARAVCQMIAADARRQAHANAHCRRQRRLSGAMAAHRCAVALLAHLRGLPIAQRAALSLVFCSGRHIGGLALAAACLGRCGPDDETGLAWWHRFHTAPHEETRALVDESRIMFQVGLCKEMLEDRSGNDEATLDWVRRWVSDTSFNPKVFAVELG